VVALCAGERVARSTPVAPIELLQASGGRLGPPESSRSRSGARILSHCASNEGRCYRARRRCGPHTDRTRSVGMTAHVAIAPIWGDQPTGPRSEVAPNDEILGRAAATPGGFSFEIKQHHLGFVWESRSLMQRSRSSSDGLRCC
jgi:hypothetical protein